MQPIPSPSFVTTIPLRPTLAQERTLRVRLEAARSAYNALLGECLRRSRLMRESRAWRAARKTPKGPDRSKAFREVAAKYSFRKYDLYPFIQEQRRCWIGKHLDAHTVMALGKRAFRATEQAIFKKGRARFRRAGEFRSVEGIGPKSPLGWKDNGVCWFGLNIEAEIDPNDPVIAHGLKHRVRLVRIVRFNIRGRDRYFAQLVCEGEAYKKPKHQLSQGIVGLDLGPSTIAAVSDKAAFLEPFCGELENHQHDIRRLQRQSDRQRRQNNPDCFDERGRWKKGQRLYNRTRRMRRVRQQLAELMRREQEHRRNLQRRLAHRILSMGNDVRMEGLSYRSFQRNFGRSVRFRAPGLFVSELKRTAEKMGACVMEFNTRSTMLSQVCLCGTLRKKKLSERQHECACGVKAQRDLFSAFLARYVAGDKLDAVQARRAWRRLCNVVGAASIEANGATGGASARVHPGADRGRVPSRLNARCSPVSARDVVAPEKSGEARARENPEESGNTCALRRRSRKEHCNPREQLDLWPDGRSP